MSAEPAGIPGRPGPASTSLQVSNLRKAFGGVRAVRDVSFELAAGTVLGVIGPNGSGKTTMINLVSGAHRPDGGRVVVGGVDITGRPGHQIAARGVARTFQNPRVFKSMTVRQNMLVSIAHRSSAGSLQKTHASMEAWLHLLHLEPFADRVANELSGGQQKLVEFARAMVHGPTVVLMDEPFAGVHEEVKSVIHTQILRASSELGTAFVIVSHEVPDLVQLSGRFVCMAAGSVLTQGSPQEVCDDSRVIDAYLGAPLEEAS